ncbi:MAG: hypothetical protein IJ729_02275 [Alloprevotella sp.]|nr:hypothetical protein [Alloprevotella sp.]
MLKRHNPQLERRLQYFTAAGDAEGLLACLRSLSNTDFRTAGYLLAETLLPALAGADFWKFFLNLVPADPKAYLGTFLKAAVSLYRCGDLSLDAPQLETFAAKASTIDGRKILETLLPVVAAPHEVNRLLALYCEDRPQARIAFLLRTATAPCYYELFRNFRQLDHLPELLRRYCLQLMSRGDKLSFNLASITQAYFGLPGLPGTFSLRLEHYQLSRLDENFESFRKILLL